MKGRFIAGRFYREHDEGGVSGVGPRIPTRYKNNVADLTLLAVILIPGVACAIWATGWWAVPAFFAPYILLAALFAVAWMIGPFVAGQW